MTKTRFDIADVT